MSKKSTSRTGNDGDADYGSANGRSSSSEDSKCILPPNLSLKEEGATGASGDYSSTHKILTPNLDESHRNHEIQAENPHTSRSSLDEDLYGTSDVFNRNLDFLKSKLRLLNISDIESTSQQRQEDTFRSDSDYNQFSCRHGYLSTRETFLNLSSAVTKEYCKSCSSNFMGYGELNKSAITTIYETPEFCDLDKTASTESFHVPPKKHCFREDTPNISPDSYKITINHTPERVNLSQRHLDENCCTSSSISSRSFSVLTPEKNLNKIQPKSASGSSPNSGINYTVPVKKVCTREKTPRIVKFSNEISKTVCRQSGKVHVKQNAAPFLLKPANEIHTSSSTNKSWSATERTKSESVGHSEIFELGLNLPSSIIGDSTPSNKTTRLEPNIIIIDTNVRKKHKFKKRNKTAPFSEVSRPSSSLFSSGDQCRESSSWICRKYEEDTSEFSSNANSSPTCLVSTCASLTSNFPSASSENIVLEKPQSESKSETTSPSSTKSNANCLKPEVFDPLFSSSLDFPKRSMHSYIFPAISRITSLPGRFVLQTVADDNDLQDDLDKNHTHCYKNKARGLINSPTLSPISRNKSTDSVESRTIKKISTEIETPNLTISRSMADKRKKQSTDMSFYSVPSHITLDKEYSNKHFGTADSSSTETDLEEKCENCCCFNIFFPRRRAHFFT